MSETEKCWRCGYPDKVHAKPAQRQIEPWFHCPAPLNDLEKLERAFTLPAMGNYGRGVEPVMGGEPLSFEARHALAGTAICTLHGWDEYGAQGTASMDAKRAAGRE